MLFCIFFPPIWIFNNTYTFCHPGNLTERRALVLWLVSKGYCYGSNAFLGHIYYAFFFFLLLLCSWNVCKYCRQCWASNFKMQYTYILLVTFILKKCIMLQYYCSNAWAHVIQKCKLKCTLRTIRLRH